MERSKNKTMEQSLSALGLDLMEENLLVLEEVDFGPQLGIKTLYQLIGVNYHEKCMAMNTTTSDNTGLRVYTGAQVAARFVPKYASLFDHKTVCELGCGVGMVGLCVCFGTSASQVLFTDGNNIAVDICAKNIAHCGMESKASTQILSWGCDLDGQAAETKFDIVMGFELMYFKIDLPALMNTVLSLISEQGFFLHAHIFRKPGLELDFIQYLSSFGWTSLEISIDSVVSPEELVDHAQWYNVRCLVSGKQEVIDRLAASHPTWVPFTEDFIVNSIIDNTNDADLPGIGENSDLDFGSLFT